MDGEGFLVNDYWKLQTGDQNDFSESGMVNEANQSYDAANNSPGNYGAVFTCDLCARVYNHDYNLRKHTPTCKKLSNEQREILQLYFKESSSLTNDVTEKIVSEANISIKTVQYWYAEIQNRESLLGKNSDRLFGQIHECTICGKRLSKPYKLKNHMESHERGTIDDMGNLINMYGRNSNTVSNASSPPFPASQMNLHEQKTIEQRANQININHNSKNFMDVPSHVVLAPQFNTPDSNSHLEYGEKMKELSDTSGLHECNICGKRLSRADNLRDHMESHKRGTIDKKGNRMSKYNINGENIYDLRGSSGSNECNICGKVLSRSNNLRDHIESHERGTIDEKGNHISRSKYSNNIMNGSTVDPQVDWEHGVNMNEFRGVSSSGSNACNICGKRLSQPRYLKSHMEAHERKTIDEKGNHLYGLIECNICGKSLSHPQNLKRHMEAHKRNTIDEKGNQINRFKLNQFNQLTTLPQIDAIEPIKMEFKFESDMQNKDLQTANVYYLQTPSYSTEGTSRFNIVEPKLEYGDNINEPRGASGIHECNICRKQLSKRSKLRDHMESHERKTIDEKGNRVYGENLHAKVSSPLSMSPQIDTIEPIKIEIKFENDTNMQNQYLPNETVYHIQIPSHPGDDNDHLKYTNNLHQAFSSDSNAMQSLSLKKNQCHICYKEKSSLSKLKKHIECHERNTINDKGERVDSVDSDQLAILTSFFEKSPFPKADDFSMLVNQTKLPLEKIKGWFKNLREKYRRKNKELIPSTNALIADLNPCIMLEEDNIESNILEDTDSTQFDLLKERFDQIQQQFLKIKNEASLVIQKSKNDDLQNNSRNESGFYEIKYPYEDMVLDLSKKSNILHENADEGFENGAENKSTVDEWNESSDNLTFIKSENNSNDYHGNLNMTKHENPMETDSKNLENDTSQSNDEDESIDISVEKHYNVNMNNINSTFDGFVTFNKDSSNLLQQGSIEISDGEDDDDEKDESTIDRNSSNNTSIDITGDHNIFAKYKIINEPHKDENDEVDDDIGMVNVDLFQSLKQSNRTNEVDDDIGIVNVDLFKSLQKHDKEEDKDGEDYIDCDDDEGDDDRSDFQEDENVMNTLQSLWNPSKHIVQNIIDDIIKAVEDKIDIDYNVAVTHSIKEQLNSLNDTFSIYESLQDTYTQENGENDYYEDNLSGKRPKRNQLTPTNLKRTNLSAEYLNDQNDQSITAEESVATTSVIKTTTNFEDMHLPQIERERQEATIPSYQQQRLYMSNIFTPRQDLHISKIPIKQETGLGVIRYQQKVVELPREQEKASDMSSPAARGGDMCVTRLPVPKDPVSNMVAAPKIQVANMVAAPNINQVSNISVLNERSSSISAPNNKDSTISVLRENVSPVSISKIPQLQFKEENETSIISSVHKQVSRIPLRTEPSGGVTIQYRGGLQSNSRASFMHEEKTKAPYKTSFLSEENLKALGLYPRKASISRVGLEAPLPPKTHFQDLMRKVSNGRISKPKSTVNGQMSASNLEIVNSLIPNNVTITKISQPSAKFPQISQNNWASNKLSLEKMFNREENPNSNDTKQKLQQLLHGVSISVL